MAKIRIHELSKELSVESRRIIEFLGNDLTASSGLDQVTADKVREKFAPKKEEKTVMLVKKGSEEAVKVVSPSEKSEKTENPGDSSMQEAAPGSKQDQEKSPEKKKKPVFLFRPENSKTREIKEKIQKKGNDPKKAGSSERAYVSDREERRGPIKPRIATTAEQYREYAKEDVKAVSAEKKNEAEKAAAVTEPEVPEVNAASVETPVEKTQDIRVELANEKTPEASSVPTAEKTAENASEKTPDSMEKPASSSPVKKDHVKDEREKNRAAVKPQSDEPKKNTASTGKTIGGLKPVVTIKKLGERVDVNAAASTKKTFEKNNGGKVHFVDNRNKDRSSGSGDRRQGQGRNNQGGRTENGFQRKDTGRNTRSAAPDTQSAFPKTDSRKKNNSQKDKDRSNYDRTGKKAENFKNLSKEPLKKQQARKEEEVIRMITVPEVITVKELSERMKQKAADIIKKMFLQGKMMTVNTEISYEEAEAIALEYEILCEKEVEVNVIEEILKEDEEDEKLMKKRPPVVCVMGHVDHGKTSLLDAIRDTNVTAREAGGITQHIGAYMVDCNGEKITFLDTPGHEAFTAMRMRGAQATDVAVLVVAADDGVMPQTVEAINHAKAAGVEIIVAVNKIDKPAANIDRVKQELSNYELVPEDWGGSTMFVPVSAKQRLNIDELLEDILLVTEVMELKANPNREMRGIVIEAKLDKGRGPVATVLVQKGTMKVGDFVSAGSFYGRIRAMLDANGNSLKSATPSTPVEILGLNGVPNAGEVCVGHKNEKEARSYAETFIAEEKKRMLSETKKQLTMDSLFAEIQAGNIKELPIVVKADVQGSVEAVKQSLEKLSNEEVSVKDIHGGVGAINESDVSLAAASNAIVIGFNVKPDTLAKQLSESENVDMRLYKVIYQAIDDVEAEMKGMLAPVYEEKVLGHAEVRQTFKASGVGVIAGSYILDGTFERGCMVRVFRGDDQLFDGNLASLKRFKDDVKEVREGYECGIVCEKFNDIQEGDRIEAYKMVQVEMK